jgi:biopolymer transport protein ExbB
LLDIIIAQLATFGGPVLIALFVVSVVATTITVFKILQFARLGVGRHGPAQHAMQRWIAGDTVTAMNIVAHDNAQLSQVLNAAMTSLAYYPGDAALARQAGTQTALQSLTVIGKNLRAIEAVVQASPMLGLLGTVIGMIEAFGKVSEGGGAADPSALAGGIWIALTTTALGLAVAIPFYFVSVWLESRVEAERAAMDAAIAEVTFGMAHNSAGA